MTRRRVLHVLSQRPSLTGSGVTLDALVRHAAEGGWDQRVVMGVPVDEVPAEVGGLGGERLHPLTFAGRDGRGEARLDFPVPGMSDVMPYPSTRFRDMTPARLAAYRDAWRRHLGEVVGAFRPDVIHAHHLWIVSAMLKDVAPGVPVVTHGHGTGLRQMELCPHLADEVRAGCRRNELFAVLSTENGERTARRLGVGRERLRVVGAGYRDDVFHVRGRQAVPRHLLYAGKLSHAKGLPWLLDAVEALRPDVPDLVLHVAGGGAGEEADGLRRRMASMAPAVEVHGQLDQRALAELMRRVAVFVLPSFYEGLPLVLVEALACGCRPVTTALPGVRQGIEPHLGDVLEVVPLPRLQGVDVPVPDDLPAFVGALAAAIRRAAGAPPFDPTDAGDRLAPLTWRSVFRRVETLWKELT